MDSEPTDHATTHEPIAIDDLFSGRDAVHACPHGHFDAIRAMEGLPYSAAVDAYLVARYEEAREVLGDPARFSSKVPFGRVAMRTERDAVAALTAEDPELATLLASLKPRRIAMLASADNPAHKRQRRIVQTAFSGKRISAITPWIRATTAGLIDALEAGTRGGERAVDVVAGLAVPLPVHVIAQMLGVDPSRHDQFKRWSDDFIFAAGAGNADIEALKRALRGQQALFAYFAEQAERRRTEPGDDLLSGIVTAYAEAGDEIDPDEIVAMATQLLVGGNETTSALIAASLHLLARRPDIAAALRTAPGTIPQFVEEVVRREGPAQANFRVATCDTMVGGVPIAKGQQLMVMYNAANLDPAAFGSAPIGTSFPTGARHVGFGFGEHFCIGAPLARLEARIAIELTLERFATIALPAETELRYANTYLSRALVNLPLELRP